MIVYSKYNNDHRKRKYQLATSIALEDGIFCSFKSAQNAESKDFLNTFFDKYDYIIENSFSINPVKPEKISNDKIKFEYKKGETINSILFDLMERNDEDEFISVFNDYIELIKRDVVRAESPTVESNVIFGDGSKKEVDCLKVGCVDLNFDNIIFNEKEYDLIDYEWTFEFPVEYKYVVFRAITSFYASNFDYNPNAFLPLEKVYDLAGINDDDEKRFISFEYNFRKHLHNAFTISFGEFADRYATLKEERGAEYLQEKDKQYKQTCRKITDGTPRNVGIQTKIRNKIKFIVFNPRKFLRKYLGF